MPVSYDHLPILTDQAFALTLLADRSVQPLGGFMDRRGRRVSPVTQTYLISQPGWVLFEAVARALEDQGARVHRIYGPQMAPTSVPTVALTVEHLEVHVWRDRKDTHNLGRAMITWSGASGQSATTELRIKVRDYEDPIDALARQFVVHLIGGGT